MALVPQEVDPWEVLQFEGGQLREELIKGINMLDSKKEL